MAITDTTTRLVFQQKVSEYLGFYESGTVEANSGNSTTKLFDDSVDSYIKSGRYDDNRHVDKFFYVHAGTNSGSWRLIQQQNMSEGSLTVDRGMASAFTSTSQFHIYGYRPDLIQTAIDKALARCYHEDWLLVTLLDDGDMRDSGVTNWTAVGTPTTRDKVTNVQDRYMGPQATRVINDAVNEGVVSNQIYVTPNVSFRVEAVGRVQAGVADLIAYDNTGSAEIDAQNTTEVSPNREGGVFKLAFDFTIPASCEDLRIRLLGTGSSDDIRWNYVSLLRHGEHQFLLSDEIEHPDWIAEMVWRPGFPNAQWPERAIGFEPMRGLGPGGVIQVVVDSYAQEGSLWAKVRRPYAALTSDTDTTSANERWVVPGAALELLRPVRHTSPELQRQYSEAAADFRRHSLGLRYRPAKRPRVRPALVHI